MFATSKKLIYHLHIKKHSNKLSSQLTFRLKRFTVFVDNDVLQMLK